MKRFLKTTGVVVGVLSVLVGLWAVDNFVYPFKVESPNYSDVERVFAQLQFPADWKEISSSENRGLHGRGCDPLNDAGCFHKSKTFKVPDSTNAEDVKKILVDAGCPGAVISDITSGNDIKPSSNIECGTNSVKYSASIDGPKAEVYVSANSFGF